MGPILCTTHPLVDARASIFYFACTLLHLAKSRAKHVFTRGFQCFCEDVRTRSDDILHNSVLQTTSIDSRFLNSFFMTFFEILGRFFLPDGSFLGGLDRPKSDPGPSGMSSRSRILEVLLLSAP